ncbi:hypothetical protein NM688_g2251 [Phlebia brevispora]|uniref:Uncharacterized protein n=1 Tax=Phlebia brevispora TaxID=194682 RepID=A0ACC1T9A0_9APHY|nr:hypothetical protein NM688_g2251 [Phlebia brevispora]
MPLLRVELQATTMLHVAIKRSPELPDRDKHMKVSALADGDLLGRTAWRTDSDGCKAGIFAHPLTIIYSILKMLVTALTKLLGIQVPLVQGGMQWVGIPQLAAAVSNAGGLGILTALTQPNPDALRKAIRETRKMTAKPFGVNITLLPSINPPDYEGYARAAVEEGVKIFETAGNNPGPLIRFFKNNNCIVIHKCTTIRHAKSAARLGVDCLSIDGLECAGHPGEEDIGGLVLLARAAQELEVPYIASGGIADGRGLAAALALGACGANMGTRFMCTVESPIHQKIKDTIIASSEKDTVHIFRTLHNTARVFKNKISQEVVTIERRPGGAKFEDVRNLVSGARGRLVYEKGDPDYGIWTAGISMGLIKDSPTCEELVKRIEREAEGVIDSLAKLRVNPDVKEKSKLPSATVMYAPEHFATVPPPSNRLLVSASFGRILPNTLLNLFAPGRRLNVHPSLLPAYRGAAPIQHTIMDGRTETGVCVIEMMERKKGIDAGEIWGVQTTTIPGDIEFCELRDQLAALGGILLVSALRDMLSGKANSVPQALDPSAPRAPLITSDDALVDFSTMTATEIVRRYRAISHQKMLFTKLKTEKTVQLHEMTVYPVGDGAMYKGIPAPGMATYNPPTRSLIIRCADGTFLRVDKVRCLGIAGDTTLTARFS